MKVGCGTKELSINVGQYLRGTHADDLHDARAAIVTFTGITA